MHKFVPCKKVRVFQPDIWINALGNMLALPQKSFVIPKIDWLGMNAPQDANPGAASHFDQLLERIDTVFYGRVSYEKWGEYQPPESAALAE